jgi:two-component system, NtrC family, sensor histidine kinase PilS
LAGKIAAEIAHEIKNPLAAMSGSMQMLEHETRSDPSLVQLTNIVCREIERINALVTDFLWLAKSPPKAERVQPLAICEVIMATISLMKRQEEISSHYQVRTFFDVEPILRMDPYIFQQILWNLFKNAIEAMPEGGELVVRVYGSSKLPESGVRERQQIFIDIQDSGCGIPLDLQEKIFEPFFTTKEKGTGLGLSTVYQLVQGCGGRIEVHAEPGHGSTFTMVFPVLVSEHSISKDLPSAVVREGAADAASTVLTSPC